MFEPSKSFASRSLKSMSRKLLLSAGLLFVLLFSALTTTASSPLAPGDTDAPWLPPNIDEGAYLQLRESAIAELRGFREAKPDSRARAVQRMQQQQAQQRTQNPSAPTVAWIPIGPAPIPNGQTQTVVNSVSGRLSTMVVDPTNSNTIYVGAAQGGVWRSLDAGATFTPIFDAASSLAIGALTIDPNNNTRLWVGTGEPNGSADSFAGVGLYRVDSADTVPVLNGPINPVRSYLDASSVPQMVPVFNGRSISKILVNPNDSNVLFVSTAGGAMGLGADTPFNGTIPPLGIRGLYRLSAATGPIGSIGAERIKIAVAGGCFDTPCTGNRNVNDMVFDPADATANTLIAWQNGTNAASDGGIWRSTNALASPGSSVVFAQTFATTSTSTSNGRGALTIYKPAASPSVVYAASGEPSSGTSCLTAAQVGAVRKSTDGGLTWSGKLAASGGFCGGQCFYNIGLAVVGGATTALDRVHLGGNVSSSTCQRLHARSLDGGATFANTDIGLHADTHYIYVDPTTNTTVYHLNDGGLWKSTDSGTTWTSLNGNGFNVTQFQSVAVHIVDRNFTLGGTQDNGTECLGPCNQASNNTWIRADFGDGGFALVDQTSVSTSTLTLYHTYFNQTNAMGFARVTTTGAAFDGNWSFYGCGFGGSIPNGMTCAATAIQFYAPMALGPGGLGNPNTLYFGSDVLYRSSNSGATMTKVSQEPIVSGSPISAIGISRLNDNARIVGIKNGKVFATNTGANPLTDVTGIVPAKYVARAVFDPNDATLNTAWVALGGYFGTPNQAHVWKTTSIMAGTWISMSNGIPDVPVNAFVVDPMNSLNLFAGTDIGVYTSTDGGATWAPFGTGLPVVAVFDMAISNPNRILKIATHGRGMWEIAIPGAGPTAVDTVATSVTVEDNTIPLTFSGAGLVVLLVGLLTAVVRKRKRA